MEEVSIDVKPCIVYNLQQKEIHLKVKKENILEEFQCRPTSSETSTLIKEEFSVDDSDANIVIKKDATLPVSDSVPSDTSTVFKEELTGDGSESTSADERTVITEEIFVNEPDREQFIDECFSTGSSAFISDVIDKFTFDIHAVSIRCSKAYAFKALPSPQCIALQNPNQKRNEKFQCEVCNKTFTAAGNFPRHKLIHRGSKQYKCDVCNKDLLSQLV